MLDSAKQIGSPHHLCCSKVGKRVLACDTTLPPVLLGALLSPDAAGSSAAVLVCEAGRLLPAAPVWRAERVFGACSVCAAVPVPVAAPVIGPGGALGAAPVSGAGQVAPALGARRVLDGALEGTIWPCTQASPCSAYSFKQGRALASSALFPAAGSP